MQAMVWCVGLCFKTEECGVSAWWLSTQAMMCVGLGLALFALLVATIALCCECKRCNSSHAVAVLLLLACK